MGGAETNLAPAGTSGPVGSTLGYTVGWVTALYPVVLDLDANPATGRPYCLDFPLLHMSDLVAAHRITIVFAIVSIRKFESSSAR